MSDLEQGRRALAIFDAIAELDPAQRANALEAQLWPDERRFIIVVEQLFVGVTVRVADSDQLDG